MLRWGATCGVMVLQGGEVLPDLEGEIMVKSKKVETVEVVAAPAELPPVWAGDAEAAGKVAGGAAARTAAIVAAIRGEMEGGAYATDATRAGLVDKLGSYYLAGYVSAQPHNIASWIRLDKATFKNLPGDAKDPSTEKGAANAARTLASKARYNFVTGVTGKLWPKNSPQGETGEGGEGGEGEEASKAARIDEARKAYSKAVERAEAQLKKARQTLADLGANVIDEARITAAFLTLRGPMGGEPDKEG